MALSYHQTIGLFAEQISKIGWRFLVDEINHEQACCLLKKTTRKIFKDLGDENKRDALHYYDAENINGLVEVVVQEMDNRLYSI